MKITKSTIGFCLATAGFLAAGYFGVQYLGRNNMFAIAAGMGSVGAVSYVFQKPSKPEAAASQTEPTIAPIKAVGQRKAKKSSTEA